MRAGKAESKIEGVDVYGLGAKKKLDYWELEKEK